MPPCLDDNWCEIYQWYLNFTLLFNFSTDNNLFNPLNPMSDQDRIFPYNVSTISSRQVMRINKNISLGTIGWSNTKFSNLTSQEQYG